MFDIGFSELVVIGVVALVVLGPERLPKVARTAGHLFGRLQRYVATVKADLNREMDMSEFSKVKQEVQEAARAFEKSAQEHTSAVETEARALAASLEKPLDEAKATTAANAVGATNSSDVLTNPTSPTTQTDMLAAQENGLSGTGETAPAATKASHRQPVPGPLTPAQPGMLDFGIEPVRAARTARPMLDSRT